MITENYVQKRVKNVTLSIDKNVLKRQTLPNRSINV